MIRTIFFDMDGTLVDTEMTAANAVAACFGSWNIPIDLQDARFIVGRTWERAFEFLFTKYTPPIPRKLAENELILAYRSAMKANLVEVPGAREAVKSLAAEYPLALVSGSHREEIFYIVDALGIEKEFQVILGAEDYPRSKPAPDGYLKALEILGHQAEETLVFEDSEAGIDSGLAAGLKICAITSTNHFQVNTSRAHLFLKDLTSVNPAWVKSLRF